MAKKEEKELNVEDYETVYHYTREKHGLTRQNVVDETDNINYPINLDRLQRIETAKLPIEPAEVLALSKVYKESELCNYYCTNECPIGKQFVPRVKVKDLEGIVLEMLSSLNTIKKSQDRLIEISADGIIDESEIEDFVDIQEKLEKVSVTVESLKLWVQQMIMDNKIDHELYEKIKNKRK